jgi:hypothetical protein
MSHVSCTKEPGVGDDRGVKMATTAMADTYVRHLLLEEHGEDLGMLEDGGYEVPLADGVRVWVVDGNHRTRRVLSTARVLEAVEDSAELLEALNELNAVTPYGRYFWMGGDVFVEDTVLAEYLEPASLFSSIGFVAWAAENAGGHLAEQFGPFEGAEPTGCGPTATEVDLPVRARTLGGAASAGAYNGAHGVVNAGGYL